jgi:sialate O-acetylesterase
MIRESSTAVRLIFALTALAAAMPAPAQVPAALRLPRLFADGMVLQRDVPIPVWGWAPPRAAVTVAFHGQTRRVTADSTGRWTVRFPATTAGGPFALVVTAGAQHVALHDVLVGDVWVASGQSNMEWPIAQVTNARNVIAAAHDSGLRQFKVPISWAERPADDVAGGDWQPADPTHVGAFSGVAYFFAKELREHERIPIGIVNTTWGGSAIETWLSAEAQGMTVDSAARLLAAEQTRLTTLRDSIQMRIGPVPDRDPGIVGGKAVWADAALDDSAWKPVVVPGYWEEQGFANVDGIGWYRTTFTLTADEARQPATLALGPIDDDDVTWINGVEVGRTSGYAIPRTYTIPAAALHAGTNVLTVRVADYSGGGGIAGGAPTAVSLALGGTTRSLAGTWKFRLGELAVKMDGQRTNKIPVITYNQMLHPLLPYPIKGVIWYQGESNANNDTQARAYRAQFASLITSWRTSWQGSARDFPFLWVQLPNYTAPDSVPSASGGGWALQRESMTAALSLPNTGQAITIDVGGTTLLHPTNKQDPGHRLALVARKVAYGEAVLASGPTYRSHVVDGGRVLVRFDHVGGGLVARSADEATGGRVGGFAIAGADRRFVWAEARVDGDHVVVWSDRVPNPVAVRYAWANNPSTANLYNRDSLPAAPFRTDAW